MRQLSLGSSMANKEVVAMKEKERGMSSAMKMYLQRKREHDLFISKERAEFEVGKQHLAAMMGLDAVTIFGDRLRRQGKGPDPEQVLNAGKMAGSRWATQEEVAKRCLEKVTAQEHADFVALLERLVSLPFSYRVKEEIFAWRVRED